MPPQPKKCVVVPIDFSESAAPAVLEAIDAAESADAVHVLHVLSDLDNVSPGVVFGNVTDETRIEAATKYLHNFLGSHSIQGVRVATLIGDPGMQAVNYAKSHGADLIVIPSHGYHGMKHLLLGSVAERIIRYAECSVLVLRRHDAD